MSGRYVWDIEAKGLLDAENVDYTASPYCLKEPEEFVHCVGFVNVDDPEDRHTFVGYEDIKNNATKFVIENVDELIGHNIVAYDHMVMKIAFGWDYYVAADSRDSEDIDMVLGKPIIITDTMVMSKALNPDRTRHSIEYFGSILGLEKIDWRSKAVELGLISEDAPKGAEFKKYHPEMAVYMMRDCDVNVKVLRFLEKEWGDWDWQNAYTLEKAVRELISRQEQRGFFLNEALAESNVRDLDEKMEAIRKIVEPLLPPKLMGKTKQKDYTPPKTQFLKNGDPSSHIKKFVAKHGGVLSEVDGKWQAGLYGKQYTLPLPNEPVLTHEPATVKDTTHIKGWLVELGWNPSVYKERDLTVDFKKKKLTQEKFEEVVERYVAQTLESPFCKDRCDELDVRPSQLKAKLLRHDIKRPLKVYTNPSLTVGMDKEIDPNLLLLEDKFPHAKTVSEYLTYAHRRNSILGGGVDPDDDDEEAETGFLSSPRIKVDSRVPTPADTCGAGTSRFKHRFICNIPRVTSLYGDRMRGMFGVDVKDGFTQMGYDFDSLEAKIESHYVYKYEGGPEYGVSLTAEKPNDCHSVLARAISQILNRDFPRSTAKNVKYGCLPIDNTEVLTPNGWVMGKDIRVGDSVISYKDGKLVEDVVKNTWLYKDADVYSFGNSVWNVECTKDHRWIGSKNVRRPKGEDIFEAQDFKQDGKIINAGIWQSGKSGVTPDEAALMAWLLGDGHYYWSEKPVGNSSSNGKKRGIIASIAQASHKYQDEIKAIIKANGMTWEETPLNSMNENSIVSYRLKAPQVRDFLDRVVGARKQKHETDWCKWVLGLSQESLKSFIHHFWLADGYTTTPSTVVFRQNRGNIADAIVLAGLLTGHKTTQSGDKCSVIRYSNKSHTGLQTAKLKFKRKADVFCITTNNSTFVMRQGSVVTITGNCSYGAQPARTAKTVGCSLNEGQIIFDAFWRQAFPLKKLQENMAKYWETTGKKKFLIGLDKRKLPIRSKANLINSTFQSAGVICAKRAMVMHDRMLRKEGLYVDFFKDDWKNANFCQQLIAYHDEAQCEVRTNQIKWKLFKTEEEAKAAKKKLEAETGKRWSDVLHSAKGYYFGYNRAGELATIAVTEAGKYYKLNVELTAGYMLGPNWAACH